MAQRSRHSRASPEADLGTLPHSPFPHRLAPGRRSHLRRCTPAPVRVPSAFYPMPRRAKQRCAAQAMLCLWRAPANRHRVAHPAPPGGSGPGTVERTRPAQGSEPRPKNAWRASGRALICPGHAPAGGPQGEWPHPRDLAAQIRSATRAIPARWRARHRARRSRETRSSTQSRGSFRPSSRSKQTAPNSR
jgi:hypothetical protein